MTQTRTIHAAFTHGALSRGLLGLACGDAVGTSVAFQPQGSFKPLTDMEGGGPLAGSSDPNTAGNGSLMRLAPMVLYCFPDRDRLLELSANSSRTTHAAPEALECCQLLAELIHNALQGAAKAQLLGLSESTFLEPRVAAIVDQLAGAHYGVKPIPVSWLEKFHMREEIEATADALLRATTAGVIP